MIVALVVLIAGCGYLGFRVLLAERELQASHVSARREQQMRQTITAMMQAPDESTMYQAALSAAWTVLEPSPYRVSVAIGSSTLLVARSMGTQSDEAVGTALLLAQVMRQFGTATPMRLRGHRSCDRAVDLPTALSPPHVMTHAAPIAVDGSLRGYLFASGNERLSEGSAQAMYMLADQLGLALQRISLTEHVHRTASEQRFRSLVQNASDVISIIDIGGVIMYQTPSVLRVLGYEPDSLVGTELRELLHPDDRLRFAAVFQGAMDIAVSDRRIVARVLDRHGEFRQCELSISNLMDDESVGGLVLTLRDVTEQLALEEQLRHQVFHDALTGLANRVLLVERANHAMARHRDSETVAALFYIDLDDFKALNESLGHNQGDTLLRLVAERLTTVVRQSDTVARLGGDEFVVLIDESHSTEDGLLVAEKLLVALREPVILNEHQYFFSASIGVVMGDLPEDTADDLVRKAESAMYLAKRKGKNRLSLFDPEMLVTAGDRLELVSDMSRAVEQEQFVLCYQPIVALESGRIVGVEALIRWEHPVRGVVSPLDFIPLAEDNGLIVPIGRWVLFEACRQLKAWHERFVHSQPISMSANVSVRQLEEPTLVDDIASALRESGLDPRYLTIEITESVLMSDPLLMVERIAAVKALGVNLAIDDFGTGYSSLGYLSQFDVDVVKIDKSFVDLIDENGDRHVLVRGIVELTKSMNIRSVAEGIEDEAQFQALLALGCTLGQGYYFSQPRNGDALASLLEADIAGSRYGRAEPTPAFAATRNSTDQPC